MAKKKMTREKKFKKIMKEYKKGELNIGNSKKKVKKKIQAIAITINASKKYPKKRGY